MVRVSLSGKKSEIEINERNVYSVYRYVRKKFAEFNLTRKTYIWFGVGLCTRNN